MNLRVRERFILVSLRPTHTCDKTRLESRWHPARACKSVVATSTSTSSRQPIPLSSEKLLYASRLLYLFCLLDDQSCDSCKSEARSCSYYLNLHCQITLVTSLCFSLVQLSAFLLIEAALASSKACLHCSTLWPVTLL
jgi:hypothetical protein